MINQESRIDSTEAVYVRTKRVVLQVYLKENAINLSCGLALTHSVLPSIFILQDLEQQGFRTATARTFCILLLYLGNLSSFLMAENFSGRLESALSQYKLTWIQFGSFSFAI